ncbi:type II toxin-antitoxin system death-on-curing family toxin [Salmonella enterica]|uniref:Type II toxin-antitoxin system death-on-curing family toxin n=1 Tax=Salmonella enterica TaxID=28901 RepID=A0A5U7RQ39_SALER|nr:type II toxin-antitoxin system death-on-curing family toxin [Salmonella enterica]EDW0701065.1 type II toxin-antitoxin system death-on-curing family toxin [Salmonella enterica subsp. enterica]EHW6437174.1 type II toxin-antitoxin system death-on-curing family toxin [Salmonella enterica]HAF1585260.1 type II toxin-antitoxin system death-on-curing family toxin [Salmonella enterica]HAF4640884.1 type II toxin-antitoxin system death-on-curing family toxin [Salmonella enterica]
MILLTAEDVIAFNEEIIKGVTNDPGRVEAIINRVENARHYDDVTDVYELAALYLITISRAHIFLDGNKRTAFQSMALFLMVNGVDLQASHQLEEITVDAAQGKLSASTVALLLRALTEPEQPD